MGPGSPPHGTRYIPLGTGTPSHGTRYTPWTRYTPSGPGTPPLDQVHPLRTRYTPWTRYTPQDQVHPPGTPQTRYPPNQVHPPGPGTPPMTRYTPWDQVHPPGPGTPPGTEHCGRYGQRAGGTHPTGMQLVYLCINYFFERRSKIFRNAFQCKYSLQRCTVFFCIVHIRCTPEIPRTPTSTKHSQFAHVLCYRSF